MRFRVRWTETFLALTVGALLAAFIVVGVIIATEPPASSHGGTLPPCPTEDSTGCYWDADTRGNGEGEDVVTIIDGVGEVMP